MLTKILISEHYFSMVQKYYMPYRFMFFRAIITFIKCSRPMSKRHYNYI